jgi:hypothetical protein
MTEIEKKALALLNERHSPYEYALEDHPVRVLIRAIEQHEAFRQEVSDAVEDLLAGAVFRKAAHDRLDRFIISKPDPLVEAIQDADEAQKGWAAAKDYAVQLRAAIAKRGGRIVFDD